MVIAYVRVTVYDLLIPTRLRKQAALPCVLIKCNLRRAESRTLGTVK